MEVVRRCLNAPDALHLLHTIGPLTTTARIDPWIAKYIFPNSMLPSAALIARATSSCSCSRTGTASAPTTTAP